MTIQPSYSPMFVQSNIELLKAEMDKLEQLNKVRKVTDIELKTIVDKVNQLGTEVIEESSRNQTLDQVSDLLADMRTKIKNAKVLLQRSRHSKKVEKKLHIIFTSYFPTNKKDAVGHPINERELIQSLTNSLTHLEKTLDDIETYGFVVEHFKKDATFPEKLAAFRDKFINGLFGRILNKISSHIFLGHKPQVVLRRAKQEIKQLSATQKQRDDQLADLRQKQSKIDLSLERVLSKTVLAFTTTEKKKLEREIQALKKQKTKLEATIVKLETEQERVKELKIKIQEYEDEIKMARDTRANLHTLGGTNVKIHVEDVTLDAMYMSCDAFRNSLKNAGAQTYELKFTSHLTGQTLSLGGLTFPKEASDNAIDQALNALGAFSSAGDREVGWQKVFILDGRVVVITDEEADQLRKMGVLSLEGKPLIHPDWESTFSVKEWDINQATAGGTVLLTSGNAGVYEMHKREILNFLMRGMNVMTFNFRGYGQSTGSPSGEGLKRDMEAAYQYLKSQHHVPDEKILVKALCMSGGPATDLAAHHPHVNLFIDQSYANFDELVLEQANPYIENFIQDNQLDNSAKKALKKWAKKLLPTIAKAIIKLAAPAWSVEKEIGKVKGHICILATRQDTLIEIEIAERNRIAALSSQNKSVKIFAMGGEHANLWLHPVPVSKLIESSDPQDIIQAIQALPSEATAIGENYSLSYNPSIPNSWITHFIALPQYRNHSQEWKRFFETQFNTFLLAVHARAQMGELISNAVLSQIMETQLAPFTDPELRKNLQSLLENAIIKRDKLDNYKYLYNDQRSYQAIPYILEGISDDATRKQTEQWLRGVLQNAKTSFDRGLDIYSIVENEVSKAPPQWKETVQSLIENNFSYSNPLQLLCYQIQSAIQEGRTPSEIDAYINQKINGLPPQFRTTFKTFVDTHFKIRDNLLDPAGFNAQRYRGRIQMDQYLRGAGLMGTLL